MLGFTLLGRYFSLKLTLRVFPNMYWVDRCFLWPWLEEEGCKLDADCDDEINVLLI